MPVRAFIGEIAGQAPSTRKRKRAAVASFCKWAVRHELLDASLMDRIDAIEVPRNPAPADGRRRSGCCGTVCCSRPPAEVEQLTREDISLRKRTLWRMLAANTGAK